MQRPNPSLVERKIMMDKELVLKAKKHNKDAFVELINEQKTSMYKAAKVILKNDENFDQ